MGKIYNVDDFNWHQDHRRGGIIPFKFNDDESVSYFLSIQRGKGDISDFGGHREDFDENIISTILREYREESNEVFGIIEGRDLKDLDLVETEDTVDILYPVEVNLKDIRRKFKRVFNNEVSDIIEVKEKDIKEVLKKSSDKIKINEKYYKIHGEILDVFRVIYS